VQPEWVPLIHAPVVEVVSSDSLHDLPAETRLLVCCIPDAKVAEVAGRLSRVAHPWRKTVVLHTSGALAAEDKPRYHLAASIASNFLVTLQSIVEQLLQSLDIDRATAQEVMAPLVRGTLDNLAASTPEEALTGPILRGDLETVHKHGLALRRHTPHLVPVYASLAMETITLAVRSSRLDPSRAEEMIALLDKMITLPLPTAQTQREAMN
jgi:predicted short-subunit dehydrogenase-like oxidoreductase (DUF2520 family)